jgi:predicted metal-binding transcription factor (methanogenesis marker protein 9)
MLGEYHCRNLTKCSTRDYDTLVQVTPETYHKLKDKIGEEILDIILNNNNSSNQSPHIAFQTFEMP